jgi:hypothetical protein
MGVYARPGKIDIAMDLPHPIFWIEASASMPTVLKDRVVEAFQKLHERGVLHGDVALRHILIGADARVTLIDFQASRADEPNEDLGLAAAYPGEKDLEMRRVKFLLNMDNARKKEFRKSKAALRRFARNKEREQRRRELLRHGITAGLPLDEAEPLEDIKEPPVPLDELEKYWMEDANDDPRRFVVPGSSDSEVAGAISSFLQCIQDMEAADCGWSVICNAPSSPRSPLVSPTVSPRDEHRIPELPPSIKVRDFAYESTCWPGLCGAENLELLSSAHDTDKGSILGDQAIMSSHDPKYLKRRREDGGEKTIYAESLPTGKRARLETPSLGDTAAETRISSSCGLDSINMGPKSHVSHISTNECQGGGGGPVSDPRLKQSRDARETAACRQTQHWIKKNATEVDDNKCEGANAKKR